MTVASMLESVRVTRRCWWRLSERGAKRAEDAFVEFRISWTGLGGVRMAYRQMFDSRQLLGFSAGVVPMLTAIATDATWNHGSRIVGHAYLIRTDDDVVARLIVQRTDTGPNEPLIWYRREIDRPVAALMMLDGRFEECGPNIYPLAIEDE